jgi:hypothetical protein
VANENEKEKDEAKQEISGAIVEKCHYGSFCTIYSVLRWSYLSRIKDIKNKSCQEFFVSIF